MPGSLSISATKTEESSIAAARILKKYNFCASATSAYTTSYHLNSLSSSTTLNLEQTRYIGKQKDIPEV